MTSSEDNGVHQPQEKGNIMEPQKKSTSSRAAISAGVFIALYLAVYVIIGIVCMPVPILFLLMPALVALLAAPIFHIMLARSPSACHLHRRCPSEPRPHRLGTHPHRTCCLGPCGHRCGAHRTCWKISQLRMERRKPRRLLLEPARRLRAHLVHARLLLPRHP